jgi:hypothetical protein
VRFLLVLAVLAVCTEVQSQPPSPGVREASQPKQSQAESAKAQAETSKRGTEQSPLIVKVLPPEEDKNKAADDAKDRKDKSSLDRRAVDIAGDLRDFTGALVVVAIFQFLAMGIQAWYLYKQGRHLKQSSDLAREEFLATQRAFVFGQGFSVAPNIDDDDRVIEYVVTVTWQNVGRTPATDVRSWIDSKAFAVTDKTEPVFIKTNPGVSTVLGPGSKSQSGLTIPLAIALGIWEHKLKAFVWSRAEYRDIIDPKIVHHHEQCASVTVIHEPSTAHPPDGPPYLMFIAHGPQNSTS